ncbi:MAG: 8-amino-7-oxononanoate synthase [Rhodopirellula sp.]|nr:8-amino-7-oxononanoate synthase [Rhodopirellula sp.]
MANSPRSLAWIEKQSEDLRESGLWRRRSVRSGPQTAELALDGRRLVNFSSNDYLGLAADPRLAEAARTALANGWGSGASPLISGYSHEHRDLEIQLAEFEGTEAALLAPSGFAANSGSIAALAGPGDVVFTDRKNHASLLDGCRLSRADVRSYSHADCQRLRRLLGRSTGYRRRLIVTDSLFSMDGDLAPLVELADLAERHEAMLLIDEAHATGVFGDHGRGVAEQLGVDDRIPIRIGTLSKALGSVGGFIAGSRVLIEWLVNRARPYLFSTAPPAAMAAAGRAALEIVRDEPWRRQGLLQRAGQLRRQLNEHGWNVVNSASQIIPLVVGEPGRAVAISQSLLERGYYVPAIRPPTVPDGESCLRISLTCGHSEEMVAGLIGALDDLGGRGAVRVCP